MYDGITLDATAYLLPLVNRIYNANMSRAHNLSRLQEIDLVIDKTNQRLDEIRAILEDDKAIVKVKTEIAKAAEDLAAHNLNVNRAEGVVSDQKYKIERTETKLYGGKIQSPRELQDLQMESESLNKHLATLEERQLELMLEQEETQIMHDSLLHQLEKLEKDRAAQHKSLILEKEQLTLELDRYEGNREGALASVSDEDLEIYEKLRLRGGGYAVAILEGSNCNLCGLSPSESTQQIIRSGTGLVQCKQCKRILYSG